MLKRDWKHRLSDSVSKLIYFDPVEKLCGGYKDQLARYKYSFVTAENREKGLGCYHFSEVPVLFGWRNHDEECRKVSRVFCSLFKKFAWGSVSALESEESPWLQVWKN